MNTVLYILLGGAVAWVGYRLVTGKPVLPDFAVDPGGAGSGLNSGGMSPSGVIGGAPGASSASGAIAPYERQALV